jgi:hypothetical protein
MTASILFSIDLLLTIMIEIKAAIKIIVTKICIILRMSCFLEDVLNDLYFLIKLVSLSAPESRFLSFYCA